MHNTSSSSSVLIIQIDSVHSILILLASVSSGGAETRTQTPSKPGDSIDILLSPDHTVRPHFQLDEPTCRSLADTRTVCNTFIPEGYDAQVGSANSRGVEHAAVSLLSPSGVSFTKVTYHLLSQSFSARNPNISDSMNGRNNRSKVPVGIDVEQAARRGAGLVQNSGQGPSGGISKHFTPKQ